MYFSSRLKENKKSKLICCGFGYTFIYPTTHGWPSTIYKLCVISILKNRLKAS